MQERSQSLLAGQIWRAITAEMVKGSRFSFVLSARMAASEPVSGRDFLRHRDHIRVFTNSGMIPDKKFFNKGTYIRSCVTLRI
jgi:hypothetical protein